MEQTLKIEILVYLSKKKNYKLKKKKKEQNKTKITRKRKVGRMRIDCGLQIISIEAILKAIVLYIYIDYSFNAYRLQALKLFSKLQY